MMHIPLPRSSSSSSASSSSRASAYAVPTGIYSEEVLNGKYRSVTYLSYPKYYRDRNILREVNCTIRVSSDPEWDWEVTTGIWTLHIKRDGTYQSRFAGNTITRKPLGLGFYNSYRQQCSVISEMDLARWDVTMSSDSITWCDPASDFTFGVRYVHDRVIAVVSMPQDVQDNLTQVIPEWDEEDIYFGVVYDAHMDFLTEPVETDGYIWHVGETYRIRIGGLRIAHEQLYQAEGIAQKEFANLSWRKRKVYLPESGLYIEAGRLDALRSVHGSIIFNDVDTFQQGVDGYSGCEDTYISKANPDTNYGSSEDLIVSADYFDSAIINALIRFDISSDLPPWPTPGANILDVQMYLYCYNTAVHGEHIRTLCCGAWKTWDEAECTWNKFNDASDLNWDTPGGGHESDYAYFNSLSGIGYDRTTDNADTSVDEDDEDTWVQYEITAISGPPNNIHWHFERQYQDGYWNGFLIYGDWPGFNDYIAYFRSSEYSGDVTQRPKLVVTWENRSSSSSSSSSFSSSSSSCSSSSSFGPFDVKFGPYTVLRNLSFEVANPEGVHIAEKSVVYNCYALNSAPTVDYPAWYLDDELMSTVFIYCEGVSTNGYGFYSQRVSTGYTDVVFAGCVAHDSNVGIRADRMAAISDCIVFDCTTGILFPGTHASAMTSVVYQSTIRNCTYGIDIEQAGAAGLTFLGNLIDSCDVGITGTYWSLASFIDWNNFSNNAQDIADYLGSPILTKGPNTSANDPAFFDLGSNDFRIGQHMANLGVGTHFGGDGSIVTNCISYPNQGAYQRREVIGEDGSVWATGPDAHSGSAYVRMSPPFAGKHPMEWQFLTPCAKDYIGYITFWRKGAFSGTFRFYADGPSVSESQVVSVPGSYAQFTSGPIVPDENGYITIRLRASGGTGNIYIDDFAFSQSSSFSSSSSSSSFSSSSFSSSSSST